MPSCSKAKAVFKIVTSLLVIWAEADLTRANLSFPVNRAIAVADRVILPKPVRNPRRLSAGETRVSFSMVIAFSSIGRRIVRIVDQQRNSRVLNKCPSVSIADQPRSPGRSAAPQLARPFDRSSFHSRVVDHLIHGAVRSFFG